MLIYKKYIEKYFFFFCLYDVVIIDNYIIHKMCDLGKLYENYIVLEIYYVAW